MRRFCAFVLGSVVILSILIGCSPKTTPAPAPATPAPATKAPPTVSPSDAAWQKVVDAAKQEGKVTLYSFSFTGDMGKAITGAFQAKYGITVEIVGGIGSMLTERIKSERAAKKNLADTLDTSTEFLVGIKGEGLTDSYGPLPVLSETGVWEGPPVGDAEGHIISEGSFVMNLPFINTTLVKSTDKPKSYKDLLDPQWKGKILIGDPQTTPVTPRFYVTMTKNGLLDDDYFRGLAKQDIKLASNLRDLNFMVAKGDMAMNLISSIPTMAPIAKEGPPVEPLEMVEGTPVTPVGITIALLKGAPHPNAAKVFVNWLLSKEGQTVYQGSKAGRSIRKDITDFTPSNIKISPKKYLLQDMPLLVEAAAVQKQGKVSVLLGVAK